MITFRYADNFLGGHGFVFNVGERVQGFTHPLWLILLTPGLAAIGEPVYVSASYGVVLTLAFGFVIARAVLNASPDRSTGILILLLLAALLLVSDSWRSFQGLGMENPLSGLLVALIAIEVWREKVREVRLALLCALLACTRLDLALLVLPLALVVAHAGVRQGDRRHLIKLALASAPLFLWLVFARLYYGDFLPNTANAKLGVYPTLLDAISVGLDYLLDWFQYEPASVVATIASLCLGLLMARDARQKALVVGLVAYAVYVIVIGGDFMRGRMFLPVFVGALTLGSLTLARTQASLVTPKRLVPALAFVLVAGLILPPTQTALANDKGIVSERRYYDGYSLFNYLKNSKLTDRAVDLDFARALKRYAEVCGPMTIHTLSAGTMGYLTGPNVSVIETVGLTDKFIADLPRSDQWMEHPRPGHPYKWLPVSYLARRGDISFIQHWEEAVKAEDCGFRDDPALFLDSEERVLFNLTLPLADDSTGLLVTVEPATASPGDTVSLTAEGFEPGSSLKVTVLGFDTGITITADGTGSASESVVLPEITPAGNYVIGVEDETGRQASATVTVQ